MKEELQGKLVEILTSIQTAAGKASDFAMEQLPDIAKSYVAYGRAYLSAIVVGGMLALLVGWIMAWRTHKKLSNERYYDGFPLLMATTIGTVFLGGGVIANFSGMLMVWFAPKVWLLKELASFLK